MFNYNKSWNKRFDFFSNIKLTKHNFRSINIFYSKNYVLVRNIILENNEKNNNKLLIKKQVEILGFSREKLALLKKS